MTYSPEAAANLANAYELAAFKLMDELDAENPISPKTGLVRPSVLGPVCGAAVLISLSIEIALKALLKKYGGKVLRTHDHVRLFYALPKDVQDRARAHYKATALMRNKNSKGNEPLELTEVLTATKDAFESWRYAYEPAELPRHIDLSVSATAARVLANECAAV